MILRHVCQTMANVGQAFLPGERQDGGAYGDVLLQERQSVLRQCLVQRGLPDQHDLQHWSGHVLQGAEAG
jgi:hypothetical protein